LNVQNLQYHFWSGTFQGEKRPHCCAFLSVVMHEKWLRH
jgi:hypothetical protein